MYVYIYIYGLSMFCWVDCRFAAQRMRPAALAGISGGLTSALVQVFRDLHSWEPSTFDLSFPVCNSAPAPYLDIKSLILGIIIGFLLGPVIELLALIRQYWAYRLRAAFAAAVSTREPYRVIG